MYRRKRSPNLSLLILFGMIAGIAFLVYDNRGAFMPAVQQPLSTRTATAAPLPTDQPTPTPAIVDTRPRISIPVLAVNAPIIPVFLDGTSWDVTGLGRDVGHLQGTAWFDEPGNVVLSGHVELRDGNAGAFRYLEEIEAGARILVNFRGEERVYIVLETYKVEPDDLTPLYPTSDDRLTLITCGDYNFFANSYQTRVVVVAERVS